jgi:hypothetical protein
LNCTIKIPSNLFCRIENSTRLEVIFPCSSNGKIKEEIQLSEEQEDSEKGQPTEEINATPVDCKLTNILCS